MESTLFVNSQDKEIKMITVTKALPINIGDEAGINLVGPIGEVDLEGTVLQAGNHETIEVAGIEFPAPFKFRAVKVKEIFVPSENGVGFTSLGLFYDMDPMYSEINLAIAKGRGVHKEKVVARMTQILDKNVIRQHKGVRISGAALGLTTLKMNQIGIPTPIREKLGNMLNMESLNGLDIRIERFPLAGTDSSKMMELVPVDTDIEAFFINPKAIKLADGDYDGDGLHGDPSFTRHARPMIPLKPIEILHTSTTWDRVVRKHDWIPAVQLNEGLIIAKLFQGPVTNGNERLAAAAFTLWAESQAFREEMSDTFQEVSEAAIAPYFNHVEFFTGMVKNGMKVMFEITQDARKHSRGAIDRYETVMFNFLNLSLGNVSRLNEEDAAKVSKNGLTVNYQLVNLIMKHVTRSGAQGLRQFFEARPILSATIGKTNIDADMIAGHIIKYGVQSMLDVMAGKKLEEPLKLGSRKRKNRPEAEPEEFITLPTYRNGLKGWLHIQDMLQVIDPFAEYSISEKKGDISILIGKTRVRLGRIEIVTRDRYCIVKTNNDPKMSSFVIDFTSESRDPQTLVLTTIHWLIAKAIRTARLETVGSPKSQVKSAVTVAVESVIDSFAQHVLKGHVPIQSLEAQVIVSKLGVMETFLQQRIMADILDVIELPNPITREMMRFNIGLTSKSKPGRTVGYRDNHAFPRLLREAAPWIDNTERLLRECRTLASAKIPINDRHYYASQDGPIARRRMDGVFIAFDGLGVMFDDVDDNGDEALITPFGLDHFAVYEGQAKYADLQEVDANRIAQEILEDDQATYFDLETIGWEIEIHFRKVGRLNFESANERKISLISPEAQIARTWVKIWTCGHKCLAQKLSHNFMVKIGDELVPVAGFIPIESLLGKKLDASICMAYDGLVRGRTSFDQEIGAYDQINELPESHEIYDESGNMIGTGIPGMWPTFILAEDEEIKTTAEENSFPVSIQRQRMIGAEVTITKRTAKELEILSRALSTINKAKSGNMDEIEATLATMGGM